MAYRYTNTDKWNDAWYSSLKPIEKLFFNYLCDNCDIAGFIELTPKIWALRIGCSEKEVLGALNGLRRGLYYSESRDCVYIINFLKHQNNLPLNEANQCHKGIFKRFQQYKLKFKIVTIDEFLERTLSQDVKPLSSPTGIGNGNGSNIDIKLTREYIYQKRFYEEQKQFCGNDEGYLNLIKYIFGVNEIKEPIHHILKLEHQLEHSQYLDLKDKAKDKSKSVKDYLNILVNTPKYAKGKKSLYLILNQYITNDEKRYKK